MRDRIPFHVTILLILILIMAGMFPLQLRAEENESADIAASNEEESLKRFLVLPYPFYNDTIGAGLGIAASASGYKKHQ